MPVMADFGPSSSSAGADTDVVVYSASRGFGRSMFASLFATVFALFSLFAAMGPLLASALFGAQKSCNAFLMIVSPVVIIATILMTIVLSPGTKTQRAA